jgi:hypothetical protein
LSKNTNDLHITKYGNSYDNTIALEEETNFKLENDGTSDNPDWQLKINQDPIREYKYDVKIECYTHTYGTTVYPDPVVIGKNIRTDNYISKQFRVELKCPDDVTLKEPLSFQPI